MDSLIEGDYSDDRGRYGKMLRMFGAQYNQCRKRGSSKNYCMSEVITLYNRYKRKNKYGKKPRRKMFQHQWNECRRSGNSKKQCWKLILKLRKEYKRVQMAKKNKGDEKRKFKQYHFKN